MSTTVKPLGPELPSSSFLRLLELTVRSQPAPRVRGVICFCVAGERGHECWWVALEDGRFRSGMSDGVPSNAEALLYVTDAGADDLMRTGRPPPEMAGNRELIAAFAKHYFARRDILSLRALDAGPRKRTHKRRRR
jgi:hypothetical protein